MKKTSLKLLLTSVAAFTLAACGNISNVSKEGTTDNPIFPKIEKSTFNHDGSQFGSWPEWNALRLIERGMNKDQLYNLIGRPHFAEGLYGVREWDYVFNYRENGEHKICQYKVLFDKNMNAQSFFWFPNGCNGNSTHTLSADFLFDFDKDTLTAQGKQTVRELAEKVRDANDIRIEGHTDRMGSEQYNQDLSERRANTVAKELYSLGVTAKMKTIGLGEQYQIKHCDGNDAAAKECLKPNRRVEIFATGNSAEKVETQERVPGTQGPTPLYQKPVYENGFYR